MKLFSRKKIVRFEGNQIFVEDLAYNHPYKKVGDELIVDGHDEGSKWDYTIHFTPKGQLKYIHLKKHSRSIAMVSWKEEYDLYEVQTIKANGDIFSVSSRFVTTYSEQHKLVSKVFYLCTNEITEKKEFIVKNGKLTSKGQISRERRLSWL